MSLMDLEESQCFLDSRWGIILSYQNFFLVYFHRAELMKKSNGVYFPEEVLSTFYLSA